MNLSIDHQPEDNKSLEACGEDADALELLLAKGVVQLKDEDHQHDNDVEKGVPVVVVKDLHHQRDDVKNEVGAAADKESPEAAASPTTLERVNRHPSSLPGAHRVDNPMAPEAVPEAEPVAEDLEEAEPVDHPEQEAEPVDEELQLQRRDRKTKQAQRFAIMVVALCLVVVAVIVALVSVLAPGGGETPEETPTEKEEIPATLTPESYLKTILADSESLLPVTDFEGVSNHTTYQQQAFEWMLQDPGLYSYTKQRVIQRYALAALFYATRGDLWTMNEGWMSYDVDECNWYGSEMFLAYGDTETSDYPCNNETGLYERLWLSFNNLNGSFPEEVYALTSLTSMDLMKNGDLQGTISPTIQQLSNLEKLSYVGCDMSGTLPTEIGMLNKMEVLYFAKRRGAARTFSGTLPDEFTQLTSLKQFSFTFNPMSGTIPTELSAMTNLTAIGLQGCDLTGTIPTQLGELSNLGYLFLDENAISGTIPTEFGLLESLTMVHLHFNNVGGTIPTQLGSVTNFHEIILANNELTGSVPSQLGLLTNIWMLYLAHNSGLTGTLPVEFEQLKNVKAFDINGTGITGTIPQILVDAQDANSFYRFYHECNQFFPCQEAS